MGPKNVRTISRTDWQGGNHITTINVVGARGDLEMAISAKLVKVSCCSGLAISVLPRGGEQIGYSHHQIISQLPRCKTEKARIAGLFVLSIKRAVRLL